MFYKISGKGENICVLVQGFSEDYTSWNLVLPKLEERLRVIRFNHTEGTIIKLLDQLDIPSAHIVGQSMGANLALDFAREYPERVQKLVLSATSPRWNRFDLLMGVIVCKLEIQWVIEKMRKRFVSRCFSSKFRKSSEYRELLNHILSKGYEIKHLQQQLKYLVNFNAIPYLDQIKCKTLLLSASDDQLVFNEDIERLHRGIVELQHKKISSGHSIHLEQPKQYAHALIKFIDTA